MSPTSDASLASGAVGELGSGVLEAMPDYAREAAEGIGSDGRGADSGLLVREAARLLSSMLAPVCTDISLLCGGVIVRHARELNAFAIGEDNARHVGVNVRRVKLAVLVTVSVLIGVCVSVSGSIGFVGLVVPHAARMIAGPNHRRLLPASMFAGAIFLLLADLIARTLLSPVELSIGVVTSLVGAVAFVVIFYRARKAG